MKLSHKSVWYVTVKAMFPRKYLGFPCRDHHKPKSIKTIACVEHIYTIRSVKRMIKIVEQNHL